MMAAELIYTNRRCPNSGASCQCAPGQACQSKPVPEGGLRYDKGKVRYELIPTEWIDGLAEVLTQGAEKYADRNWELGMPRSKMWGSFWRHTMKLLKGERYDKESGKHHGFHIAWNILALTTYDLRGIGADDMPVPVLKHSISINKEEQ